MTNEDIIKLISSCKNRAELLQKLGGYPNTDENRRLYIGPLRNQLGITKAELNMMFAPNPRSSSTGSLSSPVSGSI